MIQILFTIELLNEHSNSQLINLHGCINQFHEIEMKTRIYRLNNSRFSEVEFRVGRSINEITEAFGFATSQIHVVFLHKSPVFQCIAVRIFTKQVEFVLIKEDVAPTIPMLKQVLEAIDWESEYASDSIEDMLERGIADKSLHLEYLNSVLDLKERQASVYYAPTLELYLNFNEELLIGFTSADWTSAESKWLKKVNGKMYSKILSEAKKFHNSELEAMEEVNIQCDSLQGVPEVVRNKFIPLHISKDGNINFYNLLIVHYDKVVPIQEFKRVNKGRFIALSELELEVGNFIYKFNPDGFLQGTTRK